MAACCSAYNSANTCLIIYLINARWSSAVLFTAEIGAEVGTKADKTKINIKINSFVSSSIGAEAG